MAAQAHSWHENHKQSISYKYIQFFFWEEWRREEDRSWDCFTRNDRGASEVTTEKNKETNRKPCLVRGLPDPWVLQARGCIEPLVRLEASGRSTGI